MFRLPVTVHRLAIAGGVVASLAVASCSESPNSPRQIAPDGASLSQNPDLIDESGRHVFHTKQWHENDARNDVGRPKPGGSGTGISYHGGPLLVAQTNVAAIYWGGSTIYSNGPAPGDVGTGSQDGSLIGDFLRGLGGSDYFNINTTYYNGSNTHVANVVNYKQFWANPSLPTSSSVSDGQMVAMLQSAFDNKKLDYDPSTVYAIFTGYGVNLGGGFGSTLQYCAYHTHGTVTINNVSRTVLYAAMPYDNTFPGRCTNGTTPPNGDAAADAEVNTLAHEIEETTTDLMGNAWFDQRGYENADKCAWNFGSMTLNGGTANVTIGSKNYLIQQNWVNAGSGGCAQSYITP